MSNAILGKPDKLIENEWCAAKRHPYCTYEVMKCTPGFGELSESEASHHENIDGSGYFRNLPAKRMTIPARWRYVDAPGGAGYRWGCVQFDAAYAADPFVTRRTGASALKSGEYTNSRVRVGTHSFVRSASVPL